MAVLPRTEGRSVRVAQQPIVRLPGGEGLSTVAAAWGQAARVLGGFAEDERREREAEDIANAREAGAGDVTIGPDGAPRLNTVDNSTAANRARRVAALAVYEARSEDSWNRTAVTLRGQAEGDPAKFRTLFDSARADALAAVPDGMRPRAEALWSRLGARHETDMLRDRLRQDDANNVAALRTGLSMARQRLWSLADLGQREGPVWTEAQGNYDTAIGRLRAAGLLNAEQEAQERALAAAEGEARTIAARTVATARGPQGAAAVPAAFRAPFEAAVQAAGLSPAEANAFAGLVAVESSWNPTARNPNSSARGLTQVIRGTAAQLGVSWEDLDRPEVALAAGARYFRQQLDRHGGNVRLALRDYYAGPNQTDPRILAEGERHATRALARAGVGGAVADQLEADLTALEMPEERRNRIVTQARGDLARVDAERRISLQDVGLAAQDLTARLHAGYDIPPDALFDLARRANDLGDPALSARLLRQAEVQGTLVAARRLPLAELQQAAAGAAARAGQEGADGRSALLADGYRRLLVAKQQALQQDALAYGTRLHTPVTGPLAPIDWTNPEAARAGLSDRVQQARRVAELEGVPALPLTAPELAGLKAAWANAAPDVQAAQLRTLVAGLGPEGYAAVLGKIGGERDGALMAVAGAVGQRDVLLARQMLDGHAIIRDAKLGVWAPSRPGRRRWGATCGGCWARCRRRRWSR
jgi:hypothetical protein